MLEHSGNPDVSGTDHSSGEDKTLYTTKETASYLGVSPSTIYRMEKRGLLSPTKTRGGQRRFSQKDLKGYLQGSQAFKTSIIREETTLYEINTKPYFQESSIEIYNTDFLSIDSVKESTIDLIVTSPPYNVGINYNSHDDRMSYEDYLSFTREWLTKCYN